MTISALKRREETKRERCWNPRRRWAAIQAMITWSESLPGVHRNTRASCLRKQAMMLRSMKRKESRSTS